MKIILASQSPRRRELLERLFDEFEIKPACIDETMDGSKTPGDAVMELSERKALAVAESEPEALVIAADTIVVCDRIFGKPEDEADAARMLRELSGRAHQVMTAVSIAKDGKTMTRLSVTDVHFRELSEDDIADYIATGEPMDKAGAYGIQGRGGLFIPRIEGDYYGVMGLPICLLEQLLRDIQKKGEQAI